MLKEIFCPNEAATVRFGKALGALLEDGDCICLIGDLGAGKTTLAKAVADGMGFGQAAVKSPTFTILNIYDGKTPLRHFDLYRINSPQELYAAGFMEEIGARGVSIVEWSDLFEEFMPDGRLTIKMTQQGGGRILALLPSSVRAEGLCEEALYAGFGD